MLDDAFEAIDEHIADIRGNGSIPGIAIAVTDRDGLVLDRVYGDAEVASGRPVTTDTLFEIGSIGKTFCALIVMQLVDEGRVALDDPVVRHLPWFVGPGTGDRITIRHLMSHTAGITAGIDGTPEPTFQVWRLRDLTPGAEPGQRFHYSNLGYKALGIMIERLESEPYPDVVQRRILTPLGMNDTEPAITNDIRSRLAVGYEPHRDDRPWDEGDLLLPATWLETATADGAIASTGADMAIFVRALLAEGGGLITPASFAEMTTPVEALGAHGYALGIYGRGPDGRRFLGHTGGMVGFISGMWLHPESGLGAVVLQNGPGHGPNVLARRLIEVVRAAGDGEDPRAALAANLAAMAAADEADEDDEDAAPAALPPGLDSPLNAITGTYRSHDPWTPVFRVILRGDVPWLLFWSEPDGFDDAAPLIPMGDDDLSFRVGEDPLGPERLRFDTVIDGHTARAWLSSWDYYRMGDA